jgi:hypothetical protein
MKNHIRLQIVSEIITSQQIDVEVGLVCDRSWKIGDQRGETIIVEKNNGWEIISGLSSKEPVEQHIYSLLKRIAPYADRINQLPDECYVELACAIYFDYDTIPTLHLDKDIIHQLEKLNANLDIDLYLI